MGYTFDYIVGHMKCEKCGEISPADCSTNMQTKICLHRKLAPYGIGSKLELDIGNIEDCGFDCLNPPSSDVTFTLLDTWECPSCGTSFNWALISIENSVIQSVKEISINSNEAKNTNYITDLYTDLGYKIINKSIVFVDVLSRPHADSPDLDT